MDIEVDTIRVYLYNDLKSGHDHVSKNDYIIIGEHLNGRVRNIPIVNFVGNNGKM